MRNKKTKILFEPASCGLSHVMRCLALAQGLRKDQFMIGFALKNTLVELVKSYGYSDIYVISDEYDKPIDYFDRLKILCAPLHIKQCLKDELEVINKFKPDLIISDFRLTSGISAEMAGVCWGSFIHSFEPLSGRKPAEETLRQAGMTDFSVENINDILRKYAKNFHPFLGKTKFPQTVDIWQLLISPNFSFIPCIPTISKLSKQKDNIHYVGPVTVALDKNIGNRSNSINLNVDIDTNIPLVYVRMNFVSYKYRDTVKKCLETLIETFKESKIQVILSTGLSIPNVHSPNIKITSFVPSNIIMKINKVIVVGTGSHTTSLETLAQGLPLLILPFGFERLLNAQRLKETGASEWLTPEQVSREQIEEIITKLLNQHSYKSAAEKQQRIIQEYGGLNTASKLLNEYMIKYGFINRDLEVM